MSTATLDRREASTLPSAAPLVLAAATDILERGWLQRGWYVREPAPLRRLLWSSPRPEEVRSACLVAAIAVAAHRGTFLVNIERDALPWIDRVWRILHDGQSPHGLAPEVRIRDLITWNDQPGRTQHDAIAAVRAAANSTPELEVAYH
jgi:hypothetical protein